MKWKVGDKVEYLYIPPAAMKGISSPKLYKGTILLIGHRGTLTIKWKNVNGESAETYGNNCEVVKKLVPRGQTKIEEDPNLSFRISKATGE